MIALHQTVVAPVLRALAPRRVVEIGALRGATTMKLLDELGPDAEVHVIDPVPQFDPSEHERRFPGRYHFHRAISHDVLPSLPPVDAALIDGDHNWYTVFHELRMLAETARSAGEPLPVMLLHDVGWPYGRRDLYYAPERVPEEFRQAYARDGVLPDRPELVAGGLNGGFANAVVEGGPRNGVMTALEDFLGERDEAPRLVVVPVHFGLAIVADAARLAARPGLTEALDALETAEGRREQAALAERLRVRKQIESARLKQAAADRFERATRRYLDVVKAALLDEHYLENEVRIEYLHRCVRNGIEPDALKLRDPRMWLTNDVRRLQKMRRVGAPLTAISKEPLYPFTTVGRTGLDRLEACLDTVCAESIPGDVATCGVWRGGASIFARAFLEAHEIEGPRVWVADTFSGPPAAEGEADPELQPKRRPSLVADLNVVREGFDRFDLLDDRVRFLQGPLDQSLADAPVDEIALLHLGDELATTARAALECLYDRVAPGGFVVVEHYDAPGCRRAVDAFRSARGITGPLERTDGTGVSWRKAEPAVVPPADEPARELGRAPLPRPLDAPPIDLSVVVVVYDMKREAARTLHSLSRAYQQDVDDLRYEVIVVENGSSPDERLDEDFVRGFGPEFRLVDLGDDAKPSPAYALNRGIALAGGEHVALMIDGAHVLTPGVLHFAMKGIRAYAPAIVTTHQWYLGPGQQGEAMDKGYDKDYEDRLLQRIKWPVDGYRLFEIGNFIGDRDWFDGLWESNCLFAPRALLEQVGGFDESFSMPGGGYANLDFFERLGATPGLTVVGMLGEASFHQVHGGTTTNQPDIAERHARLMAYREHYEELRNRPFRGPGKPRHFVGRVMGAALRSRPRWATSPAFKQAQQVDGAGMPQQPMIVPEQQQAEFIEAFWRSLAWRETTWLGDRVERAPTDLVALQELIASVRPDWIVEVAGEGGTQTSFLASICDLVDGGRVVAVGAEGPGDAAVHPRVERVAGDPRAREVVEQVKGLVGDGNALVVIATARMKDVADAFGAYAPLVGVGSYVVVEGTVVNGHPVLPGFGQGPSEAIQVILKNRQDFVRDHAPERFALTFNPGGFLKRVR